MTRSKKVRGAGTWSAKGWQNSPDELAFWDGENDKQSGKPKKKFPSETGSWYIDAYNRGYDSASAPPSSMSVSTEKSAPAASITSPDKADKPTRKAPITTAGRGRHSKKAHKTRRAKLSRRKL